MQLNLLMYFSRSKIRGVIIKPCSGFFFRLKSIQTEPLRVKYRKHEVHNCVTNYKSAKGSRTVTIAAVVLVLRR